MNDPLQSRLTPWLAPAVAALVLAAAVITYGRSREIHAGCGSPYYQKAVQEAMAGLKNPNAKTLPAAQPALPAGVSPADVYWCEQCKAYHQRQASNNTPAPPAPNTIPAAASQTTPADPTIPPLPAGLSPADYQWCANCKAYHAKQPTATLPPWEGVPFRLPGH